VPPLDRARAGSIPAHALDLSWRAAARERNSPSSVVGFNQKIAISYNQHTDNTPISDL
jgi:hypothetical protein